LLIIDAKRYGAIVALIWLFMIIYYIFVLSKKKKIEAGQKSETDEQK
jgi:cell division protein FtsN